MLEAADSLPIKETIAVATPFIKSVVNTFVTPKLESLKKKFVLDYKTYHVPTSDHFEDYFKRTYKRVSIVNTLVFNNSQRLLKDIYMPLTIRNASTEKEKVVINEYPKEIIDKYERILISDTAGMGKSTLMKRIFVDAIDRKICIPIFIELRRLNKSNNLLNEIHQQISSLNERVDDRLLFELIKIGGFTFILDGFDEISLSERDFATNDIQNFISKSPDNKYIITSRPESALASFGDFQQFTIEPLVKNEAFKLLRKYDRSGVISRLLIKKLGESEMNNIQEFLKNPLLVSLLFTAFHHRQTIPFKKHLFYRQVYDANFESHDLTKGDSYSHDKYTNLEIDDFHKVLRHIGFTCLKKDQRIEFSKDEILSIIRDSKKFCVGLDFTESDFLKDVIINVPLFTQDGSYYRWSHKSLQEYFAAQFIYLDSRKAQASILRQMYNNKSFEKFVNILDLYYDIDIKSFRNVILFDLLKNYKEYYESSYKNYDGEIGDDSITLRKEISFLEKPFLFYVKKKSYDLMVKEPVAFGLNHDILQDALQSYIRSNAVENGFNGLMLSSQDPSEIHCILLADAKIELLNLLVRKKDQLVDHLPRVPYGENEGLDINHPTMEEYKLDEVTDQKGLYFNDAKNFDNVNKLILKTKLHAAKISTKHAFKLFDEIKLDIDNESADDYLLDGI